MSDFITLKQTGQAQLLKELDALSDALKVKAIRSGLASVAKPITASMKGGVHSVSGDLKKSVGRSNLSARQKSRMGLAADGQAMLIGPNKKVGGRSQSLKAARVEGGTRSHKIKAERAGLLTYRGRIFGSVVNHPGAKAKPFIAPAMRGNIAGVRTRFYQGLEKWLVKNA